MGIFDSDGLCCPHSRWPAVPINGTPGIVISWSSPAALTTNFHMIFGPTKGVKSGVLGPGSVRHVMFNGYSLPT